MYNGNRMKKLVDNSAYEITQVNGQRTFSMRFYKPCESPPKGCELFVGKLPRDIYEDELVPIFSSVAPIYKLRLMVDFMGLNRGYCFVRYFTREDADVAMRQLNNYEVRPGSRIGVYKSLDNTRLFIGGLPEDKTKHEIREALEHHLSDIKDIIMYPGYNGTSHNRGYAFLEFHDHKAAAIARRQLPPGALKLWGLPIKIDWAEPLPEPDPVVMSKVTTLYMRNIPTTIDSDECKEFLYDVINPHIITKVHKMMDYAFVHFINRGAAEEAKYLLRNFTIGKNEIEVLWARPESYSRKYSRNLIPQHFCLSLPARSRWLVKRKSFGDRFYREFSSESDDIDGNSQRSENNNSPILHYRRDCKYNNDRNNFIQNPSTSNNFNEFFDF